MTIKYDIYAAHTAPDAYVGGAENPAIQALRIELQGLIDDAVKNNDQAMCQQLLVFGNNVGDYARRGRDQTEAAVGLANPLLSEARLVMNSAKTLLNKEGEITEEEKQTLLKEIETKLGV